jgi:hypothetical protein
MLSYKNDPTLKEMFVAEIRRHREEDRIIQRAYEQGSGEDWQGCSVGCAVHSINLMFDKDYGRNDHSVYAIELGIPTWLARLQEHLFEHLPQDEAVLFPERFAEAVPVGADLGPVKWQFCAYLMRESGKVVSGLAISDSLKEMILGAISDVEALHAQAIETGVWPKDAAEAAAKAAEWAAEAAAEWAAAYHRYADELIRLLSSTEDRL